MNSSIDEILQQRVIEPLGSSPVVLVQKKDRGILFCQLLPAQPSH